MRIACKGYILTIIFFGFSCHFSKTRLNKEGNPLTNSVLKIEMKLSAFGVESDNFPSINAYIDFFKDSSNCKKSFYNPKYKDSIYSLSKLEIDSILFILNNSNLGKLKKEYTINLSDQPSSTIIIYTKKNKFVIDDYGLRGEYPLQKLYQIVYKL